MHYHLFQFVTSILVWNVHRSYLLSSSFHSLKHMEQEWKAYVDEYTSSEILLSNCIAAAAFLTYCGAMGVDRRFVNKNNSFDFFFWILAVMDILFIFLFVGNEWESFSCECARVMGWKFNPSISLIVSLFRNFSRARFVFLFATSKLSVKRHVHPPKHFAKELLPISLRPNQTLIWVDLTQVKIVRWDKRRT